jgi:hypothetical protein
LAAEKKNPAERIFGTEKDALRPSFLQFFNCWESDCSLHRIIFFFKLRSGKDGCRYWLPVSALAFLPFYLSTCSAKIVIAFKNNNHETNLV